MSIIFAIPFLGLLATLQVSILSNIRLLDGMMDLILLTLIAWALQERVKTAWQWCLIGGLMMTLISAMPSGSYVLIYAIAVGFALVVRRRLWQIPVLSMITVTFLCTILYHLMTIIILNTIGRPISLEYATGQVIVPSILLNMLMAIPIYTVVADVSRWFFPVEVLT